MKKEKLITLSEGFRSFRLNKVSVVEHQMWRGFVAVAIEEQNVTRTTNGQTVRVTLLQTDVFSIWDKNPNQFRNPNNWATL